MNIHFLEPLQISEERAAKIIKGFSDQGHEVQIFPDRTEDLQELIHRSQNADTVVISNIPLGREFFDACTKLKYLCVAFSGTDHIDLEACKSKGINVSNSAGYADNAVAELAVGMAIQLLRHTKKAENHTRSLKGRDGLLGNELFGKTVGIIGPGRIGSRTAECFKALGCRIISTRKQNIRTDSSTQCDLDTLLQESDIISLHVPLKEDTRDLISGDSFQMMKKSAILINCARGPVVNSRDLAKALQIGKIAGAATDVYEKEPPLAAEHPLFSAPNLLMMPHIAYATQEAMEKRIDIVLENLHAWMNGTVLRQIV